MDYKVVRTQSFQSILVTKMRTIKLKIQAFSIFSEIQTFQTIEHHKSLEFRV